LLYLVPRRIRWEFKRKYPVATVFEEQATSVLEVIKNVHISILGTRLKAINNKLTWFPLALQGHLNTM
jgi:hypothetical protein